MVQMLCEGAQPRCPGLPEPPSAREAGGSRGVTDWRRHSRTSAARKSPRWTRSQAETRRLWWRCSLHGPGGGSSLGGSRGFGGRRANELKVLKASRFRFDCSAGWVVVVVVMVSDCRRVVRNWFMSVGWLVFDVCAWINIWVDKNLAVVTHAMRTTMQSGVFMSDVFS